MTHAVEPRNRAEYIPSGHLLMIMLRASAVQDDQGGPWLSLMRSYSAAPRRVYQHSISVTAPEPYSTHRIVLCSGLELLGKFCSIAGVPAPILNPTRTQLRTLGEWCVERVNVPLWEADQALWLREYMSAAARDRREDQRLDAESRVRSLRWLMAEEWLR